MLVIGMTGLKGSGKDTAAAHLVNNHGFLRVAYADALYDEVSKAFGVSQYFLQNRDTKETDLPELALDNCTNKEFVELMIHEAGNGNEDFIKAPRSPRWVTQLWGTEYRRNTTDPKYWIKRLQSSISKASTNQIVVTDVRFIDEADLITDYYLGSIVRITRPELEPITNKDAHISENQMLNYQCAYNIVNNEGAVGLSNLYSQIESVVDDCIKNKWNNRHQRHHSVA